jgi:uncharacterized membrane protein
MFNLRAAYKNCEIGAQILSWIFMLTGMSVYLALQFRVVIEPKNVWLAFTLLFLGGVIGGFIHFLRFMITFKAWHAVACALATLGLYLGFFLCSVSGVFERMTGRSFKFGDFLDVYIPVVVVLASTSALLLRYQLGGRKA